MRDMYRMLLSGRTVYAIARELNRKGVPYMADRNSSAHWNCAAGPGRCGRSFLLGSLPRLQTMCRLCGRGGRWRRRVRVKRLMVSVILARRVRVWKNTVRWEVDPVLRERDFVALLARLNEGNDAFMDFHVFPHINRRRRFSISQTDPWLQRGKPLPDLPQFCQVVASARRQPS